MGDICEKMGDTASALSHYEKLAPIIPSTVVFPQFVIYFSRSLELKIQKDLLVKGEI